MNLIDIADKLTNISIHIEKYPIAFLGEELLVIADDIRELDAEVIGTISGLAQGLKEFEKENLDFPYPFNKIIA